MDQAIGAIYLIYMSIKTYGISSINLTKSIIKKRVMTTTMMNLVMKRRLDLKLFGAVFKVEFADIAFAIDSMLATSAIAVTLPKMGIHFGGMDLANLSLCS